MQSQASARSRPPPQPSNVHCPQSPNRSVHSSFGRLRFQALPHTQVEAAAPQQPRLQAEASLPLVQELETMAESPQAPGAENVRAAPLPYDAFWPFGPYRVVSRTLHRHSFSSLPPHAHAQVPSTLREAVLVFLCHPSPAAIITGLLVLTYFRAQAPWQPADALRAGGGGAQGESKSMPGRDPQRGYWDFLKS